MRVNKHLVFLEVISAFFAGLATAAILGPRILHGIPMGLAIFAVVTCAVGALLIGLAVSEITVVRTVLRPAGCTSNALVIT